MYSEFYDFGQSETTWWVKKLILIYPGYSIMQITFLLLLYKHIPKSRLFFTDNWKEIIIYI